MLALVRPEISDRLKISGGSSALAGTIHTRTGTIRATLIVTPCRIARSARRLVLHLQQRWPWQAGLDEVFHRALHDPSPQH